MSCSIRRTPSAAILAVAAAFISGGMAPAINSKGELLYKTSGGGCAAYLVATPEMQKAIHDQGAEPLAMTPEAFSQQLQRDYQGMEKIVRDAGVKIE